MEKVKKTPGKVSIGPHDGQNYRSAVRPTPHHSVRREVLFDKLLINVHKFLLGGLSLERSVAMER